MKEVLMAKDETKVDAKASAVKAPVTPAEPPSKPARSVHEDLLALVERYREEYKATGVTRMAYSIGGAAVTVDLRESGFCLTVER